MVGSSFLRTAPQDVELIVAGRNELDITNVIQMQKFLEVKQPDLVILAAAKVGGIAANSQNQKDFLFKNLEIQQSVITAADNAGIDNFIFLGSSCVYPRLANQPIKESSLLSGPLEPTNEGYAVAKITGIKMCEAVAKKDGKNFFSVMPSNLFGPNDNFDLQSSHVPAALLRKFHDAVSQGDSTVRVWGTGEPYREFMYVDNFTRACWFLARKNLPGELINVGTGSDLKIKDFAEMIARVTSFSGEIEFDLSKPDGSPRKLLDISRIRALGWDLDSNLEQELIETYTWLKWALREGVVRGYK